jgi:crossover junction endodeoxyribonuclease RuvC
MKILGIDPGSHRTGWAVLAEAAPGRPPVVVASGTISLTATAPLHERLVRLSREIGEIAQRHRPDVVAMEESFFQKNARTALVLGHARGALIAGACANGTPFAEYPPAVVKKTVGGSGRASKEGLSRLLCVQLGLAAPLDSLDASDALAVAWTHLQMLRSPLTAATAGKHGGARSKGFDVDAYLQRLSKMRQGA